MRRSRGHGLERSLSGSSRGEEEDEDAEPSLSWDFFCFGRSGQKDRSARTSGGPLGTVPRVTSLTGSVRLLALAGLAIVSWIEYFPGYGGNVSMDDGYSSSRMSQPDIEVRRMWNEILWLLYVDFVTFFAVVVCHRPWMTSESLLAAWSTSWLLVSY
eukprot:TRINITY_DN9845_c1_g1_i3.p1 TRINITY_DN9845_c1_g1~~TRINITY_DN9845_c1_g1_i3.p1  ORF type:complete len:157 (+),score=11.10 TRINITY_DN9845_c1_g1_i3:322-792(+)